MLQWTSCTINIGDCSHCSIAFTLSYMRFSYQIHACTYERTHFEAHIGFGTLLISIMFSWTCELSWMYVPFLEASRDRQQERDEHLRSFIPILSCVKRLIDRIATFFLITQTTCCSRNFNMFSVQFQGAWNDRKISTLWCVSPMTR